MSTLSTTPPRLSFSRRLLMAVLMACIMAVVCLLMLELLLRVAGIQAAALPYDNNLPDAVLGMRPEPNKYWKANFPEYPGELYMRTNNHAFYEAADTAPKPASGIRRIGVVGDSLTVGTCKPEENYPNLVEAQLNQAEGRVANEVLDAGVGRYSPYQYYLRAERELLPLGISHLVVAIYSGNDYLDLIREDDRPHLVRGPSGAFEARPPTFVVYRDPNEPPGLLEKSRVWQIGRGLLGPTILYQFSRVRLLSRDLTALGRGPLETFAYINEIRKLDKVAHGLMVQSLHQRLWFDRFPETLESAMAIDKRVMELFAEMGRARGIGITLVVIPTKPEIEPQRIQGILRAVNALQPKYTARDIQSFENTLVERTLSDARAVGLDVVDVRPALRAAAANTELYYPADMHLNVAGNHVVAGVLVEHLSRKQRAAEVSK